MTPITADTVKALAEAQGVSVSSDNAPAHARFTATVLGAAAPSFKKLAFEDEPSGHAAALRGKAR